MRTLLSFFSNTRKVFITAIILIFIASIIPFPNVIKFIFTFSAIILVYLHMFRASVVSSNSVISIILWLLIAPFFISIFVVAIVGMFWKPIEQDNYFTISFFILFIGSWIFASIIFELTKVKAAVTILNAIITTILAIVFLTSLDSDYSQVMFSEELIKEADKEGFSANSLIELSVKLITLPFVISAIWSLVVIELRSLGIIRR